MLKVEVRIKGTIKEQWSEWFDGLAISHSDPGTTILTGLVRDQAALYGIIARLRDLGMELTLLVSQEIKQGHDAGK